MENFHNIGTSTDWVVMVVYFLAIMLFGTYFGRYTKIHLIFSLEVDDLAGG